ALNDKTSVSVGAGAVGTITSTSTTTIDLTATGILWKSGINVTGTTGNDTITATGGDDTITGGVGADVLAGGAGADTFVFAAGDAGPISGTVFDIVRDYTGGAGGDTLSLNGAAVQLNFLSVDVKGAITGGSNSEEVTASSTEGVITLSGDDVSTIDTLDEWLAVARLVVTTEGTVAAFEFSGDTYVYQENTGGDLLIQLENVVDISVVGTVAAPNTILVAFA
ncbi:MAG: hypothetical protein PHW78_00835, partial [Macromonas bipunctata]|nr:hypothetical protein [Macromonas bipunctata]